MTQSTTVSLVADTWQQLTNADATYFTVQNLSDHGVILMGMSSATDPTDTLGHIMLPPGGLLIDEALISIWPGAVRLYAKSWVPAEVTIGHG